MAKEPVGITFVVPENQDAIGIYEAEGGVEVFETDEPYLLSDGKSLVDPMPVRMVDGPIYQDALGNAQSALAITLVSSWSPADLFANGEQGALWGPLPYYSDAAGTVEANWGDPVGLIPDASGNGNDWTHVTSTARPILGRVPVGGRRNLLRNTTSLVSAPWIVSNIVPTPITAPFQDAFLLTDSSDGGEVSHYIQTPSDSGTSSAQNEIILKAGTKRYVRLSHASSLFSPNPNRSVVIDLLTGATSDLAAATSVSVVEEQDGWFRVALFAADQSAASLSRGLTVLMLDSPLSEGVFYQGDGTGTVFIAEMQREATSVISPPTTYQRVGNEYDATEAGVKEIHYLRFDGTDDQVTTTLPAISGGTIVLAGTNGIWIDEIDFAGGEFSVGPGTYTDGPDGLMSILGDILVEGGFVIDRALTPEEIAKVKGYYVARGSAGLIELGPDTGSDGSDVAGWTGPEDGSITSDGEVLTVVNSLSSTGVLNRRAVFSAGVDTSSSYLVELRASNGDAVALTGGFTGTSGADFQNITSGSYEIRKYLLRPANSAYTLRTSTQLGATWHIDYLVIRRLIMPGETP